MKTVYQILLSILVLAGGGAGVWALTENKPEAEKHELERVEPTVKVTPIELTDVQLRVHSEGTVLPRTEIQLVPEVSGRVVEVSPSLVNGGFFEAGDVLLRIDPRDFELAVHRARAEVQQAEFDVTWEQAEAASAVEEWNKLSLKTEASPLVKREPQLARARAARAAAQARLEQAELDLSRTEIKAPFAGRVRSESVGVGQFVTRGAAVAQLYAVDYAEVRLPLPDSELAWLDLPMTYRGEQPTENGPAVVLSAEFAGRRHEWSARIVRTEGQIDTRTRMVHVVARVDDPYGRHSDSGRPPLAAGLFVQAEILGKRVRDVAVVPRSALQPHDRVLVVDGDDKLWLREVGVLRKQRDTAIVQRGLGPEDRLCTTPMEAFTDGMKVTPVKVHTPAAPQQGSSTGESRK